MKWKEHNEEISLKIFNILTFYISFDKKAFDDFIGESRESSTLFNETISEILKCNSHSGLQDEVDIHSNQGY